MSQEISQGVILDDIEEEDWLLGAADFGKEVLVADGDWQPYKPTNEKQRRGFESMCCTNFSSTSTIETYFTYLIEKKRISIGNLEWLSRMGYFDKEGKVNFSDRFDAIVSGTGDNGNSLKVVAQAKHKYGLIPDKMFPWTDNKRDYFDEKKITQEMYEMGKEFLRRFPINYELARRSDFKYALKYSPLAIACYAWNSPVNGIYQRSENRINHAIELFKAAWKIFDSYDPFIKILASDYVLLSYAVRYIIRENVVDTPIYNNSDMLQTIKAETDKRIFIQSNSNPKKLIWINDPDGSSWEDYKFFLDEGLVSEPKIISDALLPTYEIVSFAIKGEHFLEPPTLSPFGNPIKWIISKFKKKPNN